MALFHDGFLPEAAGLTDSYYPVLYCDGELVAVDMNRAASDAFGDRLRFADMKEYLPEEDASDVLAMLYSCEKAGKYDGVYVIAKTRGAREFTWVLVAPRFFINKVFAEFRLFRTRRELLAAHDSKKLMFPVKPVVPKYSCRNDRTGSEALAVEVGKIFAYNTLSNLYDAAMEDSAPVILDLAKTAERIITETARSFGFNKLRWKCSRKGDAATFPVIDRRGFINIIALTVFVFSAVSDIGEASLCIDSGELGVTLEFITETKRRNVSFVGEFNINLLGKMFSGIGCHASALAYICSIFNVGYYARSCEDRKLTLGLVFSREKGDYHFEVKHLNRFDMNGLREAAELIRCLGGFER